MKKISSVLFFSLFILISTQTFAQRFGVQAGVNIAKMMAKDDDDNYSDQIDALMGFNAGVNFEIGFGDLFAVEAALLADTKGYKVKDYMGGGDDFKASALYVDLPILVKVGPSFGPIKVFGAAGPFVGFGVTGKYKLGSESEDIEWGDGDEETKRLDYGAKFGIGAEVSSFNLGIYYSLGLANLSNDDSNGYKENTRVFSVSVGYKFGGK